MRQPMTVGETGPTEDYSGITQLPAGFRVEKDSDGDWVLIPPENVIIFSAPGEGVLLGVDDGLPANPTQQDAERAALNYLRG